MLFPSRAPLEARSFNPLSLKRLVRKSQKSSGEKSIGAVAFWIFFFACEAIREPTHICPSIGGRAMAPRAGVSHSDINFVFCPSVTK